MLDEWDLGIFNRRRHAEAQWRKWCRETHAHGAEGTAVVRAPLSRPPSPDLFVDDTPPLAKEAQRDAGPTSKKGDAKDNAKDETKAERGVVKLEGASTRARKPVADVSRVSPTKGKTPAPRAKPTARDAPVPVVEISSTETSPAIPERAPPAVVALPAMPRGTSSVTRPAKTPLGAMRAPTPISPSVSSPSSLSASSASPADELDAGDVHFRADPTMTSSARLPPPPFRLVREGANTESISTGPRRTFGSSAPPSSTTTSTSTSASPSKRFVNKNKRAVYGNLCVSPFYIFHLRSDCWQGERHS